MVYVYNVRFLCQKGVHKMAYHHGICESARNETQPNVAKYKCKHKRAKDHWHDTHSLSLAKAL